MGTGVLRAGLRISRIGGYQRLPAVLMRYIFRMGLAQRTQRTPTERFNSPVWAKSRLIENSAQRSVAERRE